MSETLKHPSTERLQAFVEEVLDGGDRTVVDSHVQSCARCRSEVDGLRSLFAALASLPPVAPPAGFADRVMARVRVRRPAYARLLEWIDRWIEELTPSTARGWAVAMVLIALPVLSTSAMAWWVLSHPGVTVQSLWLYGSGMAAEALASGGQWAWSRFAGSAVAASLASLLEALATLGRGGIGLLAVMFGTLTIGSVYILYQNLFRANERRSHHASYVF